MNDLISSVLESLPFQIPFFCVYVDDSITAVPENKIQLILNRLNSYHTKIQFTYEIEENSKINFLDVEVSRNQDGTLLTNWFTKPTSSGRILNFYSNNPTSQKVATITGLLNRAERLSHVSFHHENVLKIKNLLHKNNYPTSFINQCINKKNGKSFGRQCTLADTATIRKHVKFPFINNLSQKINQCFNTSTKLAFYNLKTTSFLYTPLKDPTPILKQSNLIYGIPCSCGSLYIGQTKQYLGNRLNQHKNDCKANNFAKREKTALAMHHFDTGHNFNFDNAIVLERESNWYKRNISEMIHINWHKTVNMRSDTQGLSIIYSNILNKYKQLNIKVGD